MLFEGRHHRSLDPKGRLMLPPEFRDILLARSRDGLFVMTTYDDCVVVYPQPDWEELAEKFNTLRTTSRRVRDFRRLVIGGAEKVSLDKQGRVRFSQSHCDYAGLSKELVLVGQGRTFEVWDQARFGGVTSQNFDDVAEELAESGIDFAL
ncbi:division/cell wall cluster transcriptional repressor MraZ [uncultured Cohaesibacter sp.]|uniref:division/cell wall cluster transcriptional repressor MraZ n=1 Tax=uncultured Cohaesibacter sp. TaxID=1002546 RepID=UPI0029C787D0|nr:division/cell wall cluster transcriptional repressor MraZ [uncultured Cohaesibacter sp.]